MNRLNAWCQALHILALGLWFGVLMMTGAAAAMTFPIIKSLTPTLPGFSAFPNDAGQHSVILAGHLVSRFFLVSDAVQFACASVCIATLGFLIARRRASGAAASLVGRTALMGLAVVLVCYELFILAPTMATNMQRYWSSAKAGELAAAAQAKAAFDADHPVATTILASTAGVVALLLLLAAWPRTVANDVASPPRPVEQDSGRTKLEPPSLLRGSRT